MKYAILVVYQNGQRAFLRHGAEVGAGPIVKFRSKRDAAINLEFIEQGLDGGASASVVLYAPMDESAEKLA